MYNERDSWYLKSWLCPDPYNLERVTEFFCMVSCYRKIWRDTFKFFIFIDIFFNLKYKIQKMYRLRYKNYKYRIKNISIKINKEYILILNYIIWNKILSIFFKYRFSVTQMSMHLWVEVLGSRTIMLGHDMGQFGISQTRMEVQVKDMGVRKK